MLSKYIYNWVKRDIEYEKEHSLGYAKEEIANLIFLGLLLIPLTFILDTIVLPFYLLYGIYSIILKTISTTISCLILKKEGKDKWEQK